MSDADPLADMTTGLAGHFQRARVPEELRGVSDERAFQRWAAARAGEWLRRRFGRRFWAKGEASGGGIVPVVTFGAGSWPDVAIGSDSDPTLLALELKCVKKRGLPNRIAHAIGQALMYRELYPSCLVVLILVEDLKIDIPQTFKNRLAANQITVSIVKAFQRVVAEARA